MARPLALVPAQLRRPCDPTTLGFATTADLSDGPMTLGQERAVAAIQFSIAIRDQGYNLFALGPAGGGKHSIVRQFLEDQAAAEPPASDWCYVQNFEQPHKPSAVSLPPGRGPGFRHDMARLVDDLRTVIRAALETEEYRQRHQQIDKAFHERRQEALTELAGRAAARGVALVETPMGFALGPMYEGRALDPDGFKLLPDAERQAIGAALKEFEGELERLLHLLPRWRREAREEERALKRSVISAAVESLFEELAKGYDGLPEILAYLSAVKADVIEHADDLRRSHDDDGTGQGDAPFVPSSPAFQPLGRYQVNVLHEHDGATGAPVVYEDKPTFQNLVGRIEHVAQMGTLVTHFMLIKAGALHRANGGYLILDARRVLLEPFAWEGLKRSLRAQSLRIETLGEAFSLVSTVSLEPEPIPLTVKVVLIGDRLLYYLLHEFDPDFRELFKVAADFEGDLDREEGHDALYARLVATLARRASLRPFAASAVARVIEHGARVVSDAGKLWLGLDGATDLLREANHWAGAAGRSVVEAEDVQHAIDAWVHRSGRPRARLQEAISRGTLLIATTGGVVGQLNGLSVAELGGYAFAWPVRITARARFGAGKVIDIEREVELGGPIHSKGVLILSGFLGGHYLPDQPLSLSASLVFEQSYGGVEGDSASLAECVALLSVLADLPLRQGLALTGSINQHGQVQPIGAVNEKIEGFFDVCAAQELTGDQGVVIPAGNLRHLMLRTDVVEAVAAGRFSVYAIETVDEALELLTDTPAGVRDDTGRFPPDSVHGRVEARLRGYAERAHALRAGADLPGSQPGKLDTPS